MVYIPKPGLFSIWIIILLGCLTYVADMSMMTIPPEIAVTERNKELLKEFAFSCDETWIIEGPDKKCNEDYTYVMLFNQEGKILEQRNLKNESWEWTAERKSVNIPNSKTTKNKKTDNSKTKKHKKTDVLHDLNFLFRFIWDKDSVQIMSSDEKVLTATYDGEYHIVDKDKPCPSNKATTTSTTTTTITTPTTTTNTGTATTTPQTILSNECQERKWKLIKKGIFLEIRNAKDESKKLKFSGSTLMLDNSGELFTGIKTNFRTGYHLDKSNTKVRMPYEPILDNAYGDIVIEFEDRNGQPQESFVCDYNWDQDDSDTLCLEMKYEASIPTFDGFYSLPQSDFGISGVDCNPKIDSKFVSCPFKVGGNQKEKLLQNSMQAFGGDGYSCSMTNIQRDIGGIICGSVDQITKLQKSEIKCQENLRQKGTPGQMFSLEKQVRKFSDKISEDKHWSEFLLPIPLSVSLLAAVILTSANVRPIILEKPNQGFAFLKWDSLEANLIFVSNSIADSFFLSHTEMISLKLEAQNIHRSLGKIVKYAYQRQSTTNVRRVKRFLKKMTESATQQVNHVVTIIDSFEQTNSKLNELIEALGETKTLTKIQRKRIEEFVTIKNKTRNAREVKQKKLEEKRKNMEEKAKKAKKDFFAKTELLLKQQCIYEGNNPCNTCRQLDNLKLTDDKGEYICAEKTVNRCKKHELVKGKCLESVVKEVDGYDLWGLKWGGSKSNDNGCARWDIVKTCTDMDDSFCPRFKYRPAGSYCFENTGQNIGQNGTELCGKCNHIEKVEKDMEKMTRFSSTLLKNMLNGQPNNEEFVEFLKINQQRFTDLLTDLQNYHNQIDNASGEKVETNNNKNGQNGEKAPINLSAKDAESTSQKPSISSQKPSDESSTASFSLEDKMKNNLLLNITTMKSSLETSENLFGDMDEKSLQNFCQKVLSVVDKISTELKGDNADFNVKGLLENVESLKEEGQRLLTKFGKMKANDRPTVEAIGMKRLGEEFASYQESQIERIRLKKQIISLTKKLEDSIEQILAKQIEGSDLDAVIVYLRETSEQLIHISTLWTELKAFFTFIATTVKRTQSASGDAKDEFFVDTEETPEKTMAAIDDLILDKETLKNLKQSTVEAMAYNSYTYRIAKFYNKMMVGSGHGLLAKVKLVQNEGHKYGGPNHDEAKYKMYKELLSREAKAMQKKIKDEISDEEQIIHDRLADNIKNIENQFACSLKDADTKEEKKEYLGLMNNAKEFKNHANRKQTPKRKKIETPEPNLDRDMGTDFGMD